MQEKNRDESKVKVHILNKEYTIKTKGHSPQYVRELAAMVNEQMELIQKQNPIVSRDDVALLVALNLADQLQKIKQDYEELTNLIEECRGV